MRKIIFPMITIMVLLIFFPCELIAGHKLFKKYEFGMSEENVRKIPGAYKCDDAIYCIDNQSFLGINGWQYWLEVVAGKLMSVSLVRNTQNISQEEHNAVSSVLGKRFNLIALGNRTECFDILKSLMAMKQKEYEKKATAFEQAALNDGFVNYVFLDAPQDCILGARNLKEAIGLCSNKKRLISYALESAGRNGIGTQIKFTIPSLAPPVEKKKDVN